MSLLMRLACLVSALHYHLYPRSPVNNQTINRRFLEFTGKLIRAAGQLVTFKTLILDLVTVWVEG